MHFRAVNKAYIVNIPHVQDSELRPVDGADFVRALQATYGEKKVLPAMKYLMYDMPNTYSGTADFKRRFEASVATAGTQLAVADQRYIADMTQRIVSGMFKI